SRRRAHPGQLRRGDLARGGGRQCTRAVEDGLMPGTRARAAARAREDATFDGLFEQLRQRQQAFQATSPPPSRVLLESARAMAAHMRMPEPRMRQLLAPMAIWQAFLPSALSRDTWDFDAVRERLPWSFARVRGTLQALEARPQLVAVAFHMAAFPLLTALIGAAWRELPGGPLHLLISSRNLGWLRLGNSHWVSESAVVIDTSPAGLRQLTQGLRSGTITRLLIMVDGPHAPGPE